MITAIGDVMRACYARGWITTRDGNASLRRKGSKHIYITPSGWRKNLIYPELLIKLEMDPDLKLKIPANVHPSGELHMHYLLLRHSTRTRAVLHVHPTHVVAALYRGFDLVKACSQFPEIYRYTRVGPPIPALRATSKELGEATAKGLGLSPSGDLQYDLVPQCNHGVAAVAGDPWSAFEHVERLDHICEILLKSGVTPEEVENQPTVFAVSGGSMP